MTQDSKKDRLCTADVPKEQFLRLIEQMLGRPPLTLRGDEPLSSIEEWDSLASVELLALLDERFGLVFDVEKVAACGTLDQLYTLIQQQ